MGKKIYNINLPYYKGKVELIQKTYIVGVGEPRVALQLISVPDEDDPFPEPVATCTVNLPEEPLQKGEVIIKSWAGNEGMEGELQRLKIIGPAKRWVPTDYTVASVHDLLI